MSTLETLPSSAQVPKGDELFLDHVGHFVPDAASAREAVLAYGFTATPIAIHSTCEPDGSRLETGTGNFCMMLSQGYIEVLFAASETPLSSELRQAVDRHAGVHLFAVSTSDAEAHSRRWAETGFAVRPVSHMRRAVAPSGAEARFTVARLKWGEMEEGRFQVVTHHTPDLVWQDHLIRHDNGALGLLDVVIRVADPAATTSRLRQLFSREPQSCSGGYAVPLERGAIRTVASDYRARWAPDLAQPPTVVGYGVSVRSLEIATDLLDQRALPYFVSGNAVQVPFPGQLGVGSWFFVERVEDLPWRSR